MKITIIGSGNVAFHLGKRMSERGIEITQVIGRNVIKTTWLGEILRTNYSTDISKVNTISDVYILAVADSAIEDVSKKLHRYIDNQLVVHTSGSVLSLALKPYFKNFGIFYPLQTFSVNSQPNFEEIPIFVNSENPYCVQFLKELAKKISPNVYVITDEERMTLHIAAVFVNNFVNHLFKIGSDILAKQNFPFDIMFPLIEETVNKIKKHTPTAMQTGPAHRTDNGTIEKHLAFLAKQTPQYDLLYSLLSISINPNLELNKKGNS